MRKFHWVAAVAMAALLAAPLAEARGGGGGGFGGGGRGGFGGGGRGGFGGGGWGGKFGGGKMGGGFGGIGGLGGFLGAGKNKGAQGEQALAELEDRQNLIKDRRARLSENDRASNQEARLAALRLAAAVDRVGDDVR